MFKKFFLHMILYPCQVLLRCNYSNYDMYKLIGIGFLALVFLASGTAHAQIKSGAQARTQKAEFRKSANVDIACIGTAVASRENSLTTSLTTLQSSITTAYTARSSALATAYTKTEKSEVRAGVKSAWSTFKKDVKSARASWKQAQKSAWSTFKTSTKNCKASKEVGDAANASAEVAI